MSSPVSLTVNGRAHRVASDGEATLIDVLRNELHLKGTRYGCGAEGCGACMVLVDGKPTLSCTTPVAAIAGKAVTTIEGLGSPAAPHALQEAFLAEQAAQCGYCTSGMIVSAAALLAANPHPSEDDVRAALDRNLCRCATYSRIVRAVMRAARALETA
jgi:nicotinate dehydrogenase subunit A